jgi:hypothetical protein
MQDTAIITEPSWQNLTEEDAESSCEGVNWIIEPLFD